jgi:hypothetical protein
LALSWPWNGRAGLGPGTDYTSAGPADAKEYHAEDYFPNLQMEIQSTPDVWAWKRQVQTGKEVIFSWFKDKESVGKWYFSEIHQKLMNKTFPGKMFRTPLENVPDDSGPILVIASFTYDPQAKLGGRFHSLNWRSSSTRRSKAASS